MDADLINSTYFSCSNASRTTITEASESIATGHFILGVLYIPFVLVGLPWNLLVIVTILKQRLYIQPTIILLLNLVITDFLEILLIIPFDIVTGLAKDYVFGNSDYVRCNVCRVYLIYDELLYLALIYTITMLAFDRFLFISKPLHYEKLVTAKRMLIAVVVMWLISAIFSLFPFVLLRGNDFSPVLLYCQWNTSKHENYHIFTILVLLLPYLLVLVCNIWIVYIVIKNIRAVYMVHKTSKDSRERTVSWTVANRLNRKNRNQKQLHLMRVFGAITFSSTIAWLPYVILFIWCLASADDPPPEFTVTACALFITQVMLHPILESTLISEVRIPMKKMIIPLCCRRKKRVEVGISEVSCYHCCRCLKVFTRLPWSTNQSIEQTLPNTNEVETVPPVDAMNNTPLDLDVRSPTCLIQACKTADAAASHTHTYTSSTIRVSETSSHTPPGDNMSHTGKYDHEPVM